jgi:aminoglycoside phosphotransferase (APT) family kinase protein
MTGAEAPAPVDLGALAAWMDGHDLGAGPITDVVPLVGGTQNILLRFTRAGSEYVLRRPPMHKRRNSDETMRREARVLAALTGSAVPHPALIAAEPGTDVLGAAFYLMAPIEGFNVRLELTEAHRDDPAWQRDLGLAMVDAIAALAAVDVDAAGLGDLGRPEGWVERQVDTWRKQYDGYRALDGYEAPAIDGLEEVSAWLGANPPATRRTGLLHGDFHFSNVIVDHHEPRLAAVVDWELATLGDPMLDLGHLLATWPGATPSSDGLGGSGLPAADEVVTRYCAATGRDEADARWFRVLACYRLALILEGTYARACAGQAPAEVGERMYRYTRDLFALATSLLEPL